MNKDETETTASETLRARLLPLTQDEFMRILTASMPGAVAILVILALLYTLYFAADLFLPIFFAIFLSIILRPFVRGMRRIGIHKTVGALIVLTGMIGAIVGGLINLSTPAEKWLRQLPSIQRDIEAKLWPVTQSIKQATEATANIQKITEGKSDATEKREVTLKAPSMLNNAFESTLLTFVQMLITVALTFFLLTQNERQTRRSFRRLPWVKHHDRLEEMFETVQKTIARFLRISAGIYVVLGLATSLAMFVLGMPNPVLWGVLAMVLGFMPYVGPMIVFGCIGVVSLLTFDSWWQILAPPVVYGILTIVEGNFITPVVLGRQLKLNPIAVFLSMLLWTWVWGMAGALLAVPILVIIVIVTRHVALIVRDSEESASPSSETAQATVSEQA
jgi:predicted PurR-regulated permease PerM